MLIESLKFRIELYADYWDKPPTAEIFVGGISKNKQEITGTIENLSVIEFFHDLADGQEYKLVILRTNKDNSQTITENEKITRDQILHIKSIEIDEIELGGLIYEGLFYAEYPEPWATQQRESGNQLPVSFKNANSMGFNGRWELTFTSPFYMWLLENLY